MYVGDTIKIRKILVKICVLYGRLLLFCRIIDVFISVPFLTPQKGSSSYKQVYTKTVSFAAVKSSKFFVEKNSFRIFIYA